ncbi:MAG: hypothetical protein JST86_11185 [Bacteroidetes bacterium]|nr:hypothetical protein [Bacteroidota bacterium]
MKYIICAIWTFCLFNSHAQNKKIDFNDPERLSYKDIELSAQKSAPSTLQLPFEKITIIDNRFDTTKLGFVPKGFQLIYDKTNIFRKLRFKNSKGIAAAIEEYYNDYYQNAFEKNGFQLLVVMKKFWLSGINVKTAEPVNLSTTIALADYWYFKWEYYIGKNGYYVPVKRVDTMMTVTEDMLNYVDGGFSERKYGALKFLLKGMIELQDFNSMMVNFDSKPKKTMAEIQAYNQRYFDIPVLKSDSIKKGVYLNFNEFKTARPSYTNFQQKKMHYNTFKVEYYINDTTGNIISNFWGFSGGEKLRFSKYGDDEIFRCGNTYQFFVQTEIEFLTPSESGSTTVAKGKAWVPWQLDMETGKIY